MLLSLDLHPLANGSVPTPHHTTPPSLSLSVCCPRVPNPTASSPHLILILILHPHPHHLFPSLLLFHSLSSFFSSPFFRLLLPFPFLSVRALLFPASSVQQPAPFAVPRSAATTEYGYSLCLKSEDSLKSDS